MMERAHEAIAIEHCSAERGAQAQGEGWREQSSTRRSHKRFNIKHLGRSTVKRVLRSAGIYATSKPGANPESCLVEPRYLFEEHHHTYGMPWALGRDHADRIRARGLEPQHNLLDFGCGALRVGIWLIPFLEAGRYCGLDSHLDSLAAAAEYEIPLHALEEKRPRLLHTEEARCDHFGLEFDRVVALSVLNHMGSDLARLALARLSASTRQGGLLMATERIPVSDEELEGKFGFSLSYRDRIPSRFVKGATLWQEYRRA